jgi:hypothetical protein
MKWDFNILRKYQFLSRYPPSSIRSLTVKFPDTIVPPLQVYQRSGSSNAPINFSAIPTPRSRVEWSGISVPDGKLLLFMARSRFA